MSPTDKQKRVHTSTVVVSVIDPECIRYDTRLDQRSDQHYRIEWFSGTVGAGGQHRNRHKNSARITHIPTGMVKTSQGRDRTSNKRLAMEALNTSLDEAKKSQVGMFQHKEKRSQTGSGMRGDKVRTYRFQDDTTVDHRSGKRCSTKRVMKGEFEKLL